MARSQLLTLVVGGALLLGTATLPAQDARRLEISFRDGTVTLIAANVTVREILAEWARRGGSEIINGDKLAGGPLTLQFENAPEREVVDTLLRSAAGYILGPRRADSTGGSQFGVISILPTSQAVAPPMSGMPASAPVRTTGPDDEIPPVTPPIGVLDPNRPVNPPASTNPNNQQPQPRPNLGTPASGVVPIVPISPVTTAPGTSGSTTTPPATGRGRGGLQ